MTRLRFVLVVLLGIVSALVFLPAKSALADGWVTAGSSTRLKTLGPFTVKVYRIVSLVKEKPKERSRQGVITHDVDKQLLMYMHRDVDADKMKNAFREAFKMNGYGDTGKVEQFVGALGKGDVVEHDKKGPPSVTIAYNPRSQSTTITVPGHGNATVPGVDFMKAVWSIWYGKIDQPTMGDELMASLPKD
jgi:hypothetical protein